MRFGTDRKRFLRSYTGIFLLTLPAVFFLFLKQGKSFVWVSDGREQYLPYLMYMGRYLRDFIVDVLHGSFGHKMFDLTIGMGTDVGSILRVHPLELLSVFVPEKWTEVLYVLIQILRLYLAGLSFAAFGTYWNIPGERLLAGTFVYVFCGYSLKLGIQHPIFLTALIVLPLLLLAAERMMRREGYLMFALITFLGFICNYYFMYMCSAAMALYVLIRFPDVCKEHRMKGLFSLFIRMMAAFLLGVGMACATLLPTVLDLRSSIRLGIASEGSAQMLHYKSKYYLQLIKGFVTQLKAGYNTYLNYALPSLAALLFLFTGKRIRRELKIGYVLCSAMLCVPFAGYAMAGFSNVNNRWVFVFGLVVALSVAALPEQLVRAGMWQWIAALLAALLYNGYALHLLLKQHNQYLALSAAMLDGFLLIALLLKKLRRSEKTFAGLTLIFVLASILLNANLLYKQDSNWGGVAEFMPAGSTVEEAYQSPLQRLSGVQELSDANDTQLVRADTRLTDYGTDNSNITLGLRGTSVYNSLLPSALTQSLLDSESVALEGILRIHGCDLRSAVDALANVGYILIENGTEAELPYGFEKVEDLSDDTYSVYKNAFTLPFGYTYDSSVSKETYEKLSPIDRQQIAMKAVVTEEETSLTFYEGDLSLSESVDLELPSEGEGFTREGDTYHMEAGAVIELPYEHRAGTEGVLRFEGLSQDFADIATFDVTGEKRNYYLDLRSDGYVYSTGQRNFTMGLGYSKVGKTETLKLTFRKAGDYQLKGVQIIYVPMADYESDIKSRSRDALQDLKIRDNSFSGSVDLETAKVMVFSVPFDEGWSATVDGRKVKTFRANVAYTGIELPAGTHSVVLHYETPGGRMGFVVALIAWITFAVLAVKANRKKKRKK